MLPQASASYTGNFQKYVRTGTGLNLLEPVHNFVFRIAPESIFIHYSHDPIFTVWTLIIWRYSDTLKKWQQQLGLTCVLDKNSLSVWRLYRSNAKLHTISVASPASGHVGTCPPPPWRFRNFSARLYVVWFGLVLWQTLNL